MTDTPHTPTPWHVYEGGSNPAHDSVWREGRTVAAMAGDSAQIAVAYCDYFTDGLARANAALIVRAVNSHDDLVKALDDALGLIGSLRWPSGSERRAFDERRKTLVAALQKARS